MGRNRDYGPRLQEYPVSRANGLGNGSAPHQPDQQQAEHSGHNAGDAQRRFRAFDRGCSQTLGGSRERGKKQSFDHEYETERETQQYGNVAHVLSTYESTHIKGGPVIGGGKNSIQLVHDGTRWWITAVAWNSAL